MGIACLSLFLEGFWIFVLALLPMLLFQLAVVFAADWLMKRRRAKRPAPPPVPWFRHHATGLGALVGGAVAAVLLIVNGPILGATT